jgi:hypothetical protein
MEGDPGTGSRVQETKTEGQSRKGKSCRAGERDPRRVKVKLKAEGL